MVARTIGIIMNGVTGRMGTNQHLIRSILAIRQDGGILLSNGERLIPDPILVGRNEIKVSELAQQHGIKRWSTNIDICLSDPFNEIYFDAQATSLRKDGIAAAILAGKHVYCEKPLATNTIDAYNLAHQARQAGIKHGVVQDKLFLPGLIKLRQVIRSGFLGKIHEVRGDFGYWVFEGDLQPPQRPSWNYKAEHDGGIIVDMVAHWDYVLDDLFAPVSSLFCLGATHISHRIDEQGQRYDATADDAAYITFLLQGNIIVQFNSSWATRVYRDDLLQIQVDGSLGSAVAGLHSCKVQSRVNTPRAVWNPDIPTNTDYREGWSVVPDTVPYDNGFKAQWKLFLQHVAEDTPYHWNLFSGARGVRLSELALRSWHERVWVDVPID
jgi:predicted dehydrogenase